MRAFMKISILTLLALASVFSILEAQAQLTVVLPRTSTWHYNASQCLDSTGWEQPGYDDSAWSSGPGGFTGGETAAALLAQCSTTTLPAPAANGAAGRAQY